LETTKFLVNEISHLHSKLLLVNEYQRRIKIHALQNFKKFERKKFLPFFSFYEDRKNALLRSRFFCLPTNRPYYGISVPGYYSHELFLQKETADRYCPTPISWLEKPSNFAADASSSRVPKVQPFSAHSFFLSIIVLFASFKTPFELGTTQFRPFPFFFHFIHCICAFQN
jgi:hypothetical protein